MLGTKKYLGHISIFHTNKVITTCSRQTNNYKITYVNKINLIYSSIITELQNHYRIHQNIIMTIRKEHE